VKTRPQFLNFTNKQTNTATLHSSWAQADLACNVLKTSLT